MAAENSNKSKLKTYNFISTLEKTPLLYSILLTFYYTSIGCVQGDIIKFSTLN